MTFISGVVTYVSPAYGGSTSDRQIIERSELLEDGKFQSGDSFMADRGIMVSNIIMFGSAKYEFILLSMSDSERYIGRLGFTH